MDEAKVGAFPARARADFMHEVANTACMHVVPIMNGMITAWFMERNVNGDSRISTATIVEVMARARKKWILNADGCITNIKGSLWQ